MTALEIARLDSGITVGRFKCDEISASNLMGVKKELLSLIKSHESRIVLNFQKIQYVYSDVLEMLIHVQKKAKEESSRLILCCLQPVILDIFATTRLDSYFDIVASEKEATSRLENNVTD